MEEELRRLKAARDNENQLKDLRILTLEREIRELQERIAILEMNPSSCPNTASLTLPFTLQHSHVYLYDEFTRSMTEDLKSYIKDAFINGFKTKNEIWEARVDIHKSLEDRVGGQWFVFIVPGRLDENLTWSFPVQSVVYTFRKNGLDFYMGAVRLS